MALAANPTLVDITYCATYFRGAITWYDRSVSVDRTLRGLAAPGCRRVTAVTLDDLGTQLDVRSTGLVRNAAALQLSR